MVIFHSYVKLLCQIVRQKIYRGYILQNLQTWQWKIMENHGESIIADFPSYLVAHPTARK